MFNQKDAKELMGRSRLRKDYLCYALRELESFLRAKRDEKSRWNLWQRLVLGAMIGAVGALQGNVCGEVFDDK